MNLKDRKGIGERGPRFFSKAALLLTILPLWALWVYAYASMVSLERAVEALPRFYGMYLYKEHVRARIEETVRQLGLHEGRKEREGRGGWVDRLTEEEERRLQRAFGPDEGFIVVARPGFRILYPCRPPYGEAEFLGDPGGREAFMRTLQRMDETEVRSGYLSIASPGAPENQGKRCWYLAVVPAGADLLCVLAVPESRIRLSGGILEEAQEGLLQGRIKRFVSLTLPVVILSSLFIWILYRRSGMWNRGRDT